MQIIGGKMYEKICRKNTKICGKYSGKYARNMRDIWGKIWRNRIKNMKTNTHKYVGKYLKNMHVICHTIIKNIMEIYRKYAGEGGEYAKVGKTSKTIQKK